MQKAILILGGLVIVVLTTIIIVVPAEKSPPEEEPDTTIEEPTVPEENEPEEPSEPGPVSKDDLIILESPLPGEKVTSPLTVRGQARGPWYFEASFPVVLTDWDGRIIAEVPAQAQGEWMTEEYVPFEAVLEFETPSPGDPNVNRGSLILQKDNASGLPEHDNALEIQIEFE